MNFDFELSNVGCNELVHLRFPTILYNFCVNQDALNHFLSIYLEPIKLYC